MLTNKCICIIIVIQMINSEYKKIDISVKLGFGSAPVYQQIVGEIIRLVAAGDLSSEDRLPPVRELAKQLEVNPNTVAKSYSILAERKIIVSNKGGGTHFNENPPREIKKTVINKRVEEFCRKIIGEAAKASVPLTAVIERLNAVTKNAEALQ